MMWTRTFWRASAERATKTFAQVLAAALTASGVGLIEANWPGSLSTALMAAIISILTSIGSGAATGSPSLSTAEVLSEPGQEGISSNAGIVEVEKK